MVIYFAHENFCIELYNLVSRRNIDDGVTYHFDSLIHNFFCVGFNSAVYDESTFADSFFFYDITAKAFFCQMIIGGITVIFPEYWSEFSQLSAGFGHW